MNHSQPSRIQNRVSRIEHRESNYLRAYKALHLSRNLYKSPLFMQNKPNLVRRRRIANERKYIFTNGLWKYKRLDTWWKQTQFKPNLKRAQMNINSLITKDYRKKDDFAVRINKPNSNPIKACPERSLMGRMGQFPKVQNEYKLTYNKGLWKKWHFRSPGKQTQFKPNCRKGKIDANCVFTKDYEEKCG